MDNEAVQETATLKIKARVNEACSYTNTATITSSDPDPNNNTSTVTPAVASFRLYKTGVFNDLNSNGFASTNETITYTFKLKNTGNVIISGIQLSDPLLGGAISGPISGDLNGDSKNEVCQGISKPEKMENGRLLNGVVIRPDPKRVQ
ncbi:DUF11 domain-containing protein [Pedobacter sp. V48]|uniref:DUF7507 domain-containing protein n=1 Tax=Pedobacter sp. V48 TaxID=509635 RepID=UPI0003E583F8|nr:DUF11 domain-containing protein [Pedobacter sp. V48]ETZ22415.1 hypothetical protein N824_01840 [Pedobacter sp. V48]